ncbi:MAG: polyhydroxyalkanoic acid system family protein [Acidobacteria bacterium]|nr:polyhydroxyalkanoic acid system family protein [Acidobacteriota bacterium]MBV9475457.1 polyhydroxyalkanoic acid system family protein [Acidobacteriota bacterium]
MRIAVPHHTTKTVARQKVEQRLGQLLGQFGGHADEVQHDWSGDTLRFKGKARGLSVEGTLEVTDSDVVISSKLPLIAMPFEGKIRQAVEKEAESMFRMG